MAEAGYWTDGAISWLLTTSAPSRMCRVHQDLIETPHGGGKVLISVQRG